MREARRSQWWTIGKPCDKADASIGGQPFGWGIRAAHCGVAARLCSRATRHSPRHHTAPPWYPTRGGNNWWQAL